MRQVHQAEDLLEVGLVVERVKDGIGKDEVRQLYFVSLVAFLQGTNRLRVPAQGRVRLRANPEVRKVHGFST